MVGAEVRLLAVPERSSCTFRSLPLRCARALAATASPCAAVRGVVLYTHTTATHRGALETHPLLHATTVLRSGVHMVHTTRMSQGAICERRSVTRFDQYEPPPLPEQQTTLQMHQERLLLLSPPIGPGLLPLPKPTSAGPRTRQTINPESETPGPSGAGAALGMATVALSCATPGAIPAGCPLLPGPQCRLARSEARGADVRSPQHWPVRPCPLHVFLRAYPRM